MAGEATLHDATTLRRNHRHTTLRRYVVRRLFTPPMSQSKASCHESGIDRQRHRPADALTPGTHARTEDGTYPADAPSRTASSCGYTWPLTTMTSCRPSLS